MVLLWGMDRVSLNCEDSRIMHRGKVRGIVME